MRRTVVLPAGAYRKARRFVDSGCKFCYLGKDSSLREKAISYLGRENRFMLGSRLHETAEALRQPFLDFMAGMGAIQIDSKRWWAGTFSARSPWQSDFFLFLCYKAVASDLISKFVDEENSGLCILVEDPWLIKSVELEFANHPGVEFAGDGSAILRRKALNLAKGIAFRIALAGYLFLSSVMVRLLKRGMPVYAKGNEPVTGIISFAEERALTASGYNDPYTGGLAGFLVENGRNVIRPIFPNMPVSLIPKVCRNDELWPLAYHFKIGDLRHLFSFRRIDIPENAAVMGYPVKELIEREISVEFCKAGAERFMVMSEMLKRFLKRFNCPELVYFFENQAWEKVVCMTAREVGGVRTVGYQHSTIPQFLLMYFLGRKEAEIMPLPDIIIASGTQPLRLMQETGYPPDRLRLGGTWRYGYLRNMRKEQHATVGDIVKILVALPVDRAMALSILNGLIAAFGTGGHEMAMQFHVKAHPDTPLESLGVDLTAYDGFAAVNEAFGSVMLRSDIVISSGTTGIEALLAGKVVVRVVAENLLDMDPLAGTSLPCLVESSEDNLRESLLCAVGKVRNGAECSGKTGILDGFFTELDYNVWLDLAGAK